MTMTAVKFNSSPGILLEQEARVAPLPEFPGYPAVWLLNTMANSVY